MIAEFAAQLLATMSPSEEGLAFLEALAAGVDAARIAEGDCQAAPAPAALDRLEAAREQLILEGLATSDADRDRLLGLAREWAEHRRAWRAAVTARQAASHLERTSRLAHDLRSPLGAVMGALDVLETRRVDPLPLEVAMHGIIKEGSDKLLALIDRMAVPEAGDRPSVAVYEPDTTIRDVLTLYLEQAGYRVRPGTEAPGDGPAEAAWIVAVSEFTPELLTGAAARSVPILALGGATAPPGAAAWLPKPFKKAELVAAVRAMRNGERA